LIEGVGDGVKTFKIGDRVFGFEDTGLNSHAQYITLSENKAFTIIPGETSYKEAAASIEGAHYAYNMINKVKLKRGDEVLVNGATGAIGSAVVQLLKDLGANITAVANTKNLDLIKSLGANRVIDYTKEDFTLEDPTYSVIIDAVGKSSFPSCKRSLQRDGVYISSELGFMAQNIFFALSTGILGKLSGRSPRKKVIFPIPYDCKRSVLLIKKLMEEGKFKPVIDRQYPLERIAEAFTYVEKGEKTGNVIITMTDNN
jgi:NADPH:quinone reductase-like Zn-dependent oxidoreductase